MAQTRYKQDMPPQGGYPAININRLLPKSYFSSPVIFAAFFTVSGVAIYNFKRAKLAITRQNLELNDTDLSLQPFLVAERDRAYLKYLRRVYEEEEFIMKDVPGWKVGTLYGERLFKTAPPDYHLNPPPGAIYVHNSPYDFLYQWNYGNAKYHGCLEYKYNPNTQVKTKLNQELQN
ncbi:NADH dehydrogenase-like [Tropilaelaps mercedesae]|uniref:NADH dehydrogenase [ubiquinone] 1 alpha subcomplex subunit 13 n=1 Tax=Tropilaelaps mercedesae TaxID=418985 RepID=A0A1V9XYW5_9ACAR|nr:NADH dehydrogenase-like [Tropilaelaps mercedesae]